MTIHSSRALDIAEEVANQIVRDYTGLPIGADTHKFMTDQLQCRIVRSLMSFFLQEPEVELDGAKIEIANATHKETPDEETAHQKERVDQLASLLRDGRFSPEDLTAAAYCMEALHERLAMAERHIQLITTPVGDVGELIKKIHEHAQRVGRHESLHVCMRHAADKIHQLFTVNEGLRKQVANANERAKKSDYWQMSFIESEELHGDTLAENAKLKEQVADLERRCDIPALLADIEEIENAPVTLEVRDDGTGVIRRPIEGSLRSWAPIRSGVFASWSNAQPLIDYIEANRKPPLSEQLHDGARVRLRGGFEGVIQASDPQSTWVWKMSYGNWTWSWNKDGETCHNNSAFDIVEVLS